MINLLEETKRVIEENNHGVDEVKWLGSANFGWFKWEDFEQIADIEYDNGYGAPEIAQDLLVVGEDWWLERHEYDGSEWWEFKTTPSKPDGYSKPKGLKAIIIGWEDLSEINC